MAKAQKKDAKAQYGKKVMEERREGTAAGLAVTASAVLRGSINTITRSRRTFCSEHVISEEIGKSHCITLREDMYKKHQLGLLKSGREDD
jgi:hypothetical protein